ncbi:MAG: PAS/PAC sensor hybrid histidine kinase [uncultured bacterium]|nr:MAG: PAS/PAC sensor hybrid histidine kinase [uncultured bacterium]
MEAVGVLAGGVAHDYNNMLGVILGYTELALKKVDPAQPLHADLEEIYMAAKRSTDITRQLLAFARKQTIIPVVLDLNRNVESMLKMIRRLIGEDIDLAWRPGAGLCSVKMDPVQVDQILANLCVNARDAIADIGKVTIETGSTVFDENYCADHLGFAAGKYVRLTVSDDGCGMNKETLDQIFEPFSTSKGLDRGTGLGLSTVYGIVKQNDGFIKVYSEPGKGTTFRIYLPCCADQAVDTPQERTEEIPLGGGETVLVVEDETALLKMSKRMLEKLGYRVLAAATPGEAVELAANNADTIQLLITDVVMPGMNGRDLAERLQALYPNMKILFMSGYTADVIVHRGVLDEGVNFIQKPYSMEDMAVKVREVLRQK